MFKMPMVALHYVLTGDKASLAKSMEFLKWLDGMSDWTNGTDEQNSDTTASFTMVGASLMSVFRLYNDLDPAFREKFRQTLWFHARAMYYGGHLAKNPGGRSVQRPGIQPSLVSRLGFDAGDAGRRRRQARRAMDAGRSGEGIALHERLAARRREPT